ncbi:MAG: hypothetical protein JWR54_3973 [Mucilaginibacter sp.]|nr:hypothetical protein [Mucilaginibacter sp.]
MEEVKEYSLEERLNHVSVWRNSGLLLANYSRQSRLLNSHCDSRPKYLKAIIKIKIME